MDAQRFNVFGRIFELRRQAGTWRAFAIGNDGKRSSFTRVPLPRTARFEGLHDVNDAVIIKVRYQLGEYLSVLIDFLPSPA